MQDKTEILECLERSDQILTGLVKSIPDGKMSRRRGEGFWTVAEHLSHLAFVQPMLLERIERFLKEARPRFAPYIPGEDAQETLPPPMATDEALDAFRRHRQTQIDRLEKAEPAVWEKSAQHPEYDHYGLYILARHILMHDHWHMYRMEELWLTQDAYLTKLE